MAKINEDEERYRRDFVARLYANLAAKGYSPKTQERMVAERTGFSVSAARNWRTGKGCPRASSMDAIHALSMAFDQEAKAKVEGPPLPPSAPRVQPGPPPIDRLDLDVGGQNSLPALPRKAESRGQLALVDTQPMAKPASAMTAHERMVELVLSAMPEYNKAELLAVQKRSMELLAEKIGGQG